MYGCGVEGSIGLHRTQDITAKFHDRGGSQSLVWATRRVLDTPDQECYNAVSIDAPYVRTHTHSCPVRKRLRAMCRRFFRRMPDPFSAGAMMRPPAPPRRRTRMSVALV